MTTKITNALKAIGLPTTLIELIREDRLLQAIDEAYVRYDLLNARLDAWEAANPEQVPKAPWFEGREAWKRAGRPRPQWWEVLAAGQDRPIGSHDLRGRIWPYTGAFYKRRKRERLKALKAQGRA